MAVGHSENGEEKKSNWTPAQVLRKEMPSTWKKSTRSSQEVKNEDCEHREWHYR